MNDEPSAEPLRDYYADRARRARSHNDPNAPGGSSQATADGLYEEGELDDLPSTTLAASLGCANPVALAQLVPGEVVLDLGSGGGIDVLLSARRVGDAGFAYGVDMTDEMLDVARAAAEEAGVTNVEFRKGHIEALPFADGSVDVVVSNCVISVAVDKAAVFAEAWRVLRPGGRFAVADVVADSDDDRPEPDDSVEWAACAAGALTRDRYHDDLRSAGFTEISLTDSHQIAPGFTSSLVRAVKPG